MGAEALTKSDLWFYGPDFLHELDINIENSAQVCGIIDDQELRRVVCNVVTSQESWEAGDFDRFSYWSALVRGMARAKQLAARIKSSLSIKSRLRSSAKKPNLEPLSVAELQAAETLIIKAVQLCHFGEELDSIKAKEPIQKSSKLYRLSCILDKHRILRVGGRLRFTNLYSVFKHPVVLPKEAHISLLLIRECHQATQHQGRGITTNEIRARGYWIVRLGAMVKNVIRSCVTCRAQRGRLATQRMADLPYDRAECMPQFTYYGMDVFGPFLVKERRSKIKRYGVIFTCLSTRSVHLEMAYSLTADSFIQTLRKLIAIRGPIRHPS